MDKPLIGRKIGRRLSSGKGIGFRRAVDSIMVSVCFFGLVVAVIRVGFDCF